MNGPKTGEGPRGVFAVLSAPGRWIERSRGMTRLALALAAFLLMMLCALWIRHAASINGLPAIAEPFDIDAIRRARPADADNAFLLYQEAVGQIPAETIEQILLVPEEGRFTADPYLQRIARLNRPALNRFLEAADRPDALAEDSSTLPGIVALTKLALAEGGRLQGNDDLSGAWTQFRAAFRASRHLGQRSGWAGRSEALAIHADACDRTLIWAANPRIDHDLLKAAIYDLEALDAMTPPDWLTLRYEYLSTLDRLSATTPGQARPELRDSRRFDAFLRNEPERSRRVLRLIFANWLSEWAIPSSQRTHPIGPFPSLYENPEAPRDARRLSHDALLEWYASSDLASWDPPLIDFPSPEIADALLDESITRANLIVHLAERRYILDHKEPPTYPEGLLGLYLDRIPPQYQPSHPFRLSFESEIDPAPLDTASPSP